MESLLFSLNATVPVFLVMLIGYGLRQIGMIKEAFVNEANTLNYKVTLPALLFLDISKTNIIKIWDTTYVLFCAISTTICFFLIWWLSKRLIKEKSAIGAFVQGSFRSSAAVLGVAFIQNMYGTSGMAPLMIIGTVPLYNIYSVLVLTFEGREDGKELTSGNFKKSMQEILTNPIIISIVFGLLASLFSIHFPKMIDKTISNIAVLATPLALLALGAGFEGRSALSKLKLTLTSSFIKLIVQPALVLPFACMLGFRDAKLVALLIMLASPTTVSCYIMAKNLNNDGVLTSSIIVATTFFSGFTLTLWFFLLRFLEFI